MEIAIFYERQWLFAHALSKTVTLYKKHATLQNVGTISILLNLFKPGVPYKGHWVTVYTQIRRRRTRRLIRGYTVWLNTDISIKHGNNNIDQSPLEPEALWSGPKS